MAFIVVVLATATKPWTVSVRPGDVDDLARVFLWWAGAINLVPLAVLALTTRWWLRPLPGTFRPAPWHKTLWGYRRATNHVFQSVLSRLSLSAWRAVARPTGLQVNETAVRLPCYLAAISVLWPFYWRASVCPGPAP